MGLKTKTRIIVFFQLLCLVLIGLTAPVIPGHPVLLVIELSGIMLALWAILIMNPLNVKIMPFPNKEIGLLHSGPYKWIRHPMYTAIFLAVTPLVISYYSPFRLITGVVLFASLVYKVTIEEKLLESHYEHYNAYKHKTFRFIPFLY